jgi:hypothetical protein
MPPSAPFDESRSAARIILCGFRRRGTARGDHLIPPNLYGSPGREVAAVHSAGPRGLGKAPEKPPIFVRLFLLFAYPNFHAELGGIVNIESLIEPFGRLHDRGESEIWRW